MVARELTKIHEEIVRGRLSELAERFASEERARGEIVLLIDRTPIESEIDGGELRRISDLVPGLKQRAWTIVPALKKAARKLGLTRDEAYRRLVAERGN